MPSSLRPNCKGTAESCAHFCVLRNLLVDCRTVGVMAMNVGADAFVRPAERSEA